MSAKVRRREGEKGMTLIEMVAGAAILLGALLSLAAVSASTHRLRRTVFEKRTVLDGIERELASIRATDFDELAKTHDRRSFALTLEGGDRPILSAWRADEDGLPGLVQVEPIELEGGQVQLWEATITVAWRGVSGERSLRRSILLSRLGSS